MRVTKYPQSCLLIEDGGKRLLIDPGSLVPTKYQAKDLLPVDAILITHEHQDHVDPDFLQSLLADKSIPVIGNASTQKTIGEMINRVVSDGETFEVAGFHIKACELPHCLMVDGSPGPQNTGYVINNVFFDPGDGVTIEGLTVDNVAVPVAGPDISPKDVFGFVKSTGVKTVIPIHNDYFTSKLDPVMSWINQVLPQVKFIQLENGQTTDL